MIRPGADDPRSDSTRDGSAGKARVPGCSKCLFLKSFRASGASPEVVDALCRRMWLHRVPKRQTLHREGNRATHLYAIRSGSVKLANVDANGREHVTAVLGVGDLFGFEAVFGRAYNSSATALTDCEFCLAYDHDLKELIDQRAGFALDLSRYLHQQLELTRERQAILGLPTVSAKVAGYLLHCLERGRCTGDEGTSVTHDLTLGDLGAVLGVSPETVCRSLGKLKSEGIIESGPSAIHVRDVSALRIRASR